METAIEDLALDILRHTGIKPRSLREVVSQGAVNHDFVAVTPEGSVVLRFHRDPLDTDDYSKEEWRLRTMGLNGLPVPQFLCRSTCSGVWFIIQAFVEGANGDAKRSRSLWVRLGRYARAMGCLPPNFL